MPGNEPGGLTARLVGSLHIEALLLADEARAYFDEEGRIERDRLAPIERVTFSCEALKVTTRLMHVMAWLLARREAGPAALPSRRLGGACDSDPRSLAALPAGAQRFAAESVDLYARVARLDREFDVARPRNGSPARTLQSMLEHAF